jgi:hypothetical protein
MTNNCDICERPIHGERVEIRQQRPSDPSDHCCILWACAECAKPVSLAEAAAMDSPPSAMLASDWDAWADAHGPRFGIAFLS